MLSTNLFGPGRSSLASEGVVSRSASFFFGGRTCQAFLAVESSGLTSRHKFHQGLEMLHHGWKLSSESSARLDCRESFAEV